MLNKITEIDLQILDFINKNFHNEFLDKIMIIITSLADNGFIWILISVVFLFIKKHRKSGFYMILSLTINVIICNLILKPSIARIRPFDVNTFVEIIVKKPSDFSFPSGHTSASFATAIALLYNNKFFGRFALVLAFLIGFSRLYLYLHYPSDVIAGALIGFLSAFIAILILNYIFTKKFIKNGK